MNHSVADESLLAVRQESHPGCFVCGAADGYGMGLRFRAAADGGVEAQFEAAPVFEGYPAVLHGGITCALLDGAMTNCLFAHGVVAVTVDMQVRFRHPAATGQPVTVRARLDSSNPPLYDLTASVVQDGRTVATATGEFLEMQAMAWFAGDDA